MESIELKKVLKSVAFLVFILSLFLVVKIFGEIKTNRYIGSDIAPQNVINVNGRGEVFILPDTATFSFSVTAEDKTAQDVQKKVTEKMNPIIEALKAEGIDEKDIRTDGYNLYPRYEYGRGMPTIYFESQENRTLVGYELSHSITVKVKKVDDAGRILGLVGGLGATNLSSINFTVGDEEGVRRDARKMAIDNAEKKAKELADDLDVRLVRIVNFSESGPVMPFYAREADMKIQDTGASAAPSPEIPMGENQFVSDVYITYEIK